MADNTSSKDEQDKQSLREGKFVRIGVRAEPGIGRELDARGEVSVAARVALNRWFGELRAGLVQVQGVFSPEEQGCIAAINAGTIWEPFVPEMLVAQAQDCEDGYFAEWGCEREPLVAKLEGLTHQQAAAVVDAAERYRAAGKRAEVRDPRRMLEPYWRDTPSTEEE